MVTSRSWCRRCLYSSGSVSAMVAARTRGVDELLDAGDVDVVVVRGVDVLDPADRLVGDAQALEDLVVEAVLPEEQAWTSRGSRRTGRPG